MVLDVGFMRPLLVWRGYWIDEGYVMSEWIKCSDRMPEENGEREVLACFKGGDISTLYYFDGRWDDAYGIVPIRQDATHWMPLPEPPID